MKVPALAQWCIALACIASTAQAEVPLAKTSLDRSAKRAVPSRGKALLWVYRGDSDSASEPPVYVNGRFMARTAPRTFMLFSLGPGLYRISSDGHNGDLLIVRAKAGGRYYVAQTASVGEEGRSSFALSDSAAGRRAVAGSRLIDVRAAQAQERAPAHRVSPPPAPKPAPKPKQKPAAAREAPKAGTEPEFAIALRSGSLTMASTSQTIAGIPVTFDDKASSLYSFEFEYRPLPDVGVGLEVLGYKDEVSSGAATGDMSASSAYLNVRKYFEVTDTVYPYIGAGVGWVRASFSGNVLAGSATGIGSQVRLGAELRFDSFLLQLEARQVWAKPKDKNSNSVDASGRGLFAGIGLQF